LSSAPLKSRHSGWDVMAGCVRCISFARRAHRVHAHEATRIADPESQRIVALAGTMQLKSAPLNRKGAMNAAKTRDYALENLVQNARSRGFALRWMWRREQAAAPETSRRLVASLQGDASRPLRSSASRKTDTLAALMGLPALRESDVFRRSKAGAKVLRRGSGGAGGAGRRQVPGVQGQGLGSWGPDSGPEGAAKNGR
jgi:hypothetical protein